MSEFTDDAACAHAIAEGGQALWEELLDRVTDTILTTSLAWCAPSCARGTCSLLKQSGPLRCRLRSDDCDCVLACYAHIAHKHLPGIAGKYPGEGSLVEWCQRGLRSLANDTFRRIDFARTGHTCTRETNLRLHVPRLRVPDCLQDAPDGQKLLYRLLCQGKETAEIAVVLGLPLETAEAQVESLQRLVAETDWDAYVEMQQRQNQRLRPTIHAFTITGTEGTGELEPIADEPTMEQKWQLRQITHAAAHWLNAQTAADRNLLILFVREGLSANEVVSRFRGVPDSPRTARQVYARVETLLTRMHTAVQELLAHVDTVRPEKKAFIEILPCLLTLIDERAQASQEPASFPEVHPLRTRRTAQTELESLPV